jgi:hypothetical protein
MIPPDMVLLIPKTVPAKFGAKSTGVEKWPLDNAPLKNIPTQNKATEYVMSHLKAKGEKAIRNMAMAGPTMQIL